MCALRCACFFVLLVFFCVVLCRIPFCLMVGGDAPAIGSVREVTTAPSDLKTFFFRFCLRFYRKMIVPVFVFVHSVVNVLKRLVSTFFFLLFIFAGYRDAEVRLDAGADTEGACAGGGDAQEGGPRVHHQARRHLPGEREIYGRRPSFLSYIHWRCFCRCLTTTNCCAMVWEG